MKVKVLFLAANPTDTKPLRLGEEVREIDHALRMAQVRDMFDIEQNLAVRVTDLQGLLLWEQPDIVHFSGHGSETSEIILEGNDGTSRPVPADALSELFDVLKGNTRLVVLNACYSANQARAIGKHIDCVVGMSKAVGDVAAIRFAAAFYQALGYRQDVQTAFKLGCNAINLQGLREQDTPQLIAERVNPADVVLLPTVTPTSATGGLPGGLPLSGVVVGQPPPLAAAYQTRNEAWTRIEAAWAQTGTSCLLLSGDGGVGKSQLAAGIFRDAARTQVRVWVPAASLESLRAGYAAAAAAVGCAATDDPTAPRAFLQWLAGPGAGVSWLIVLDDLALDPHQMAEWWPPSTPNGRVLVTTRRDAAFDGHGRTRIRLGVYTPTEAFSYLKDRLSPHQGEDILGDALDEADGLAKDLGFLPVALAQAAAVIIDDGSTCARYRKRFVPPRNWWRSPGWIVAVVVGVIAMMVFVGNALNGDNNTNGSNSVVTPTESESSGLAVPPPNSVVTPTESESSGLAVPPPGAWITVLESLPQSERTLSDAQALAKQLSVPDHDVVVIDSSATPGLNDGYWTVSVMSFETRESAVAVCASFSRPVGSTCYPRLIE